MIPEANTYSIVGRCSRTGEIGVAVASAIPAVGGVCAYVRTGVGAVASQSWVNPYLAYRILDLLEAGEQAPAALNTSLAEDPEAHLRQVGVVDAGGRSASHTGDECTPWHGSLVGSDFAAQGNMLTGEPVVTAMAQAFGSSADEPLEERLMRALEAAQTAGGDARGRQSAAVLVHGAEIYPKLDVRVDEDADPVAKLRESFDIARLQLLPFVAAMPKRGAHVPFPRAVRDLLAPPPPDRPGGGGAREP